jgi:carbon monoxide dehydrogenase subunit G
MNGFELSEHIHAAPKKVFELISDLEHSASFIDNIKETKKLTAGPIAVGSRFLETRVMNGKDAQAELLVSAYEPPKHFGVSTEAEGIKVEYHYFFTAEGDGTNVRWVCELEASGLRKMMLPMVAGIMKKEDGHHLQKIKAVLEK